MIELGKKCTLVPYLGGKHGFINYKSSSVYTDTFNKLDEFLVSLGYLKAASSTPVSAK